MIIYVKPVMSTNNTETEFYEVHLEIEGQDFTYCETFDAEELGEANAAAEETAQLFIRKGIINKITVGTLNAEGYEVRTELTR